MILKKRVCLTIEVIKIGAIFNMNRSINQNATVTDM